MRLQLAVFRNELPPVRIVFNTRLPQCLGSQTVGTVSELLTAVNAIVPLETDDGEWGLEDYVVEVAATADQAHSYECLHYQNVDEILQEDDEVHIRALTSEDIRERRLGGRLQISSDGRHLVDGVGWGKRRRGIINRPEIQIPPRKKRRLNVSDEIPLQQIEYPFASMENAMDTNYHEGHPRYDSESTDEEYEDSDQESSGTSSNDEPENETLALENVRHSQKAISHTEVFDNADYVSEDKYYTEDDGDNNLVLNEEVQDLVADIQASPIPKVKKKKNTDKSERALRSKKVSFDGFSSPEQSPAKRKRASHDIVISTSNQQIEDDDHGSESEVESDASLSSVLSSSQLSTSSNSDSSDMTSSSESSQHSSSTSGQRSASPFDGSISNHVTSTGQGAFHLLNESKDLHIGKPLLPSEEESITRNVGIPGTGSLRTKRNNSRKKMGKHLKRLKEQGLLHSEATYEDLRAYNAAEKNVNANEKDNDNSNREDEELQATKHAALARLCEEYQNKEDIHQSNELLSNRIEKPASLQQTKESTASKQTTLETPVSESLINQPSVQSEPVHRRAKLDLASSRRMLFSSLGVRNPKTPAAEQAVRKELSSPLRNARQRVSSSVAETSVDQQRSNGIWKDRLTVLAVECEDEQRTIQPPPFPFIQPWEVRKRYEAGVTKHQPTTAKDTAVASRQLDPNTEDLHPLKTRNFQDQNIPPATTTDDTNNMDNLFSTSDIAKLPELRFSDVAQGALIAYKELHMNEKFEPEHSPYRLARIERVKDGILQLVLSEKSRRREPQTFDEDTGERIYGKFEMPVDESEEEIDNGQREVSFSSLILPRLLKPVAPVLVQDSFYQREQHKPGENNLSITSESNPDFVTESAPDVCIPKFSALQADGPEWTEISQVAATNQSQSQPGDDENVSPNDEFLPKSRSVGASDDSILRTIDNREAPNDSGLLSEDWQNHSQLVDTSSKPSSDDNSNFNHSSSYQDAQRVPESVDVGVNHTTQEPGSIYGNNTGVKENSLNSNNAFHSMGSSLSASQKVISTSLVSGIESHLNIVVSQNGDPISSVHASSDHSHASSLPISQDLTAGHQAEQTDHMSSNGDVQTQSARSDRILRSQDKTLGRTSTSSGTSTNPSAWKANHSRKVRSSEDKDEENIVSVADFSDLITDTESNTTHSADASSKKRQSHGKIEEPSGQQAKALKSSFSGLGSKRLLVNKKPRG